MSRRWLAPLVAAVALGGCAQTQSAMDTVKSTFTRAAEGPPTTSPAAGDIRPTDRLCTSLDESYEVTDNVWQIVMASGTQAVTIWRDSGFRMSGQTGKQVEGFVKELSKRYLWMPVVIEQQIGTYLHDEYPKGKIVPREGGGRGARRNYERADRALAAAVKDYPKLPYELKLFVVESDAINAEALPAGYVYVSRKAVSDLDDATLTLIVGHEVAHVAKRHTSKQIQQRIVDTGMGVDMFRQVIQSRGAGVDRQVLSSWGLINRLGGIFARYDQDQELQADACSIRGLVYAGKDPIQARSEYLRMRGGEVKSAQPSPRPLVSQAFGLSFTEHPDDEARERFFKEATSYHRKNAPAGVAVAGAAADSARPGAEAPASATPGACASIPFDKSVRSDAEPLFTTLPARDRRKLQAAVCLTPGEVDGAWGPKTKHALKRYQCRKQREPSGALTSAMVAELLGHGPDEVARQCAAP
jgi:Zn-dependent protease with chaperone function